MPSRSRAARDCEPAWSGSAAQDEESRGRAGSIRQDPQKREQVWDALDLIQDHEPVERLQRELRLRQTGQIGRLLQVEVRGRSRARLADLHGQRRLAHLAGANNPHDREQVEATLDLFHMSGATDHAPNHTMKSECVKLRYHARSDGFQAPMSATIPRLQPVCRPAVCRL